MYIYVIWYLCPYQTVPLWKSTLVQSNCEGLQSVKAKTGSANICLEVIPSFNCKAVKRGTIPEVSAQVRSSAGRTWMQKAARDIKRAPTCPHNVRAGGETHPVGTINTPDSARRQRNGTLGVHFVIDSFLMGEETERESVTWQHLQLSGCVRSEF